MYIPCKTFSVMWVKIYKHLIIYSFFSSLTWETVNARSNRTLIGKVSGYSPFVFGSSSANESRMKNKPILGSISLGFDGPTMTQIVILRQKKQRRVPKSQSQFQIHFCNPSPTHTLRSSKHNCPSGHNVWIQGVDVNS